LNLNVIEIFIAILIGIIGVFIFLYLFPGGAITTAMHQVLKLPGPGAGIGLIFGPFIIILALLTYNFTCKKGVIFITCIIFGFFHSTLTPIVYPSIETVGSLGPLGFRILAVILLGLVLEIGIFLFRSQNDLIKYPLSATIANLTILTFYWCAIFPFNKGMVEIGSIPILLGLAIFAGIIFGGLIPLICKRFF
jgi:hypothetical protein